MNIFVLDEHPCRAAQMACDQHVVKMILETAQILCTVRWMQLLTAPYKAFNPKHSCCLWAAESRWSYRWLIRYGIALGHEYTFRYGKIHRSASVINYCKEHLKELSFLKHSKISFVQCMSPEFKCKSAVEAYRALYRNEKSKFARWTRRAIPDWM